MSRIRGRDTKIDIRMREILTEMGCSFEAYPRMHGTPDFVLRRKRIIVYCDGDYWHGYGYWEKKKPVKKEELETEATGPKNLSITPKGEKALKKGDQKLSITKKGISALKKGDNKKGVRKMVTARGTFYAKEDYVSHFGDVLRQAIEEAKKVNAIDTINKIVKTKTMGKLHGQKVDLFTASAIQQVYNALNKKNQEKMISVMSKDVHGLLKMADFSMKQMKR